MTLTVENLAGQLNGKVHGDGSTIVAGLRPLDDASGDCVSPFTRKKLLDVAPVLPGAVLANDELAAIAIQRGVAAAIVHPQPPVALARLIDIFFPAPAQVASVHPCAVVSSEARVDPSCWVGPGVVIEDGVIIGKSCWIGPNTVICAGTTIGNHVRLGPSCVIGYDGFGFLPTPDGPLKVRQVGGVQICDHAELGAGVCVDRGTLGDTVIGEAAKIDNLVQVGHNSRVGRGVIMAAQTGLAGSTRIGDGAMLGGQVGVGDHRVIGSGSKVTGQSGVTRDIRPGDVVSGTPAMARGDWLRGMARLFADTKNGECNETEEQ